MERIASIAIVFGAMFKLAQACAYEDNDFFDLQKAANLCGG